jgi:hypothetical protein
MEILDEIRFLQRSQTKIEMNFKMVYHANTYIQIIDYLNEKY